ncbi:MAG TPA: tRNA uridine(34) 5-carboxymethylaminomethyl modification radical SAM/GNAT enzyme Elp3 [Candidatus Methanofastidiosa archaeon]|nr:tRNA uridine(34) 5-carboxymethylaminomethyl modification radical SAM/GNAT enzyme Elp3 [Candidatus Methanofastidiosa archaeon]HPR41151.1 tRNA uridine(34) 5-carboxymethylaminomethyl modification radical SAM/GNAT enzyme Elp3 [Candidatus Methanofastidiosa archaeon]
MGGLKDALDEISSLIDTGVIVDKNSLQREKVRVAKKYELDRIPSNSDIISHIGKALHFLQRKPMRTMSGVAVIAVMTRPAPCPHGKCTYCPGGPEQDVPQSYTGHEPAAMRAIQNNFHPFLQVYRRIEQLQAVGHPTDKIELIVMGGTFPSQDLDYQEYFVRECLSAMNLHDRGVPSDDVHDCLFPTEGGTCSEEAAALLGRRPLLIEQAQEANETADNRCIGMTFETRPDWAMAPHIDRMLSYGGTRVELGVQTVYDYIYARVKRGHTTKDVKEATAFLKDQAFKINYHMMPGLPGSDPERDLRAFERIFEDPSYRPDMVKFYTCLVLENTELYNDYKKGVYTPYTTEETVELLVKAKSLMPEWARTMRIQRDIPTNRIAAGVMRSNMGQMVEDEMKRRGKSCKCIRCREIGQRCYKDGIDPREEDVELIRRAYEASGGTEEFLSFEDVKNDALIGFIRLRSPGQHVFRKEITDRTGLIRELHVYGPMVPIGMSDGAWWQHRGYGNKLLKEAERIAIEDYDMKKMAIISGIGVREYYRKHGYERDGPYMSRPLRQ